MIFYSASLLVAVPLVIAAVIVSRRLTRQSSVVFSSRDAVGELRPSWKVVLSGHLYLLRAAALVLIIIAIARPRVPVADSRVQSEGIDIVLAVDASTSMLAEDFMIGGKRVNRIDIVKDVVRDFIKGRKNDRIGIVAFAARPYVVSPLTLDYSWLFQNLERIKAGMVEDGTAIGSGIASALNRLRGTQAKSKVVILLTDGRNNAGAIAPSTAAEAAKVLGIKVYTVGAGSSGLVPYPVRDMFGGISYQPVQADLDEETLQKIADVTRARYFRATDSESLRRTYREIDELEKSPIEERGYEEYRELFPWFLVPALLLILAEIIVGNTIARKLP